MATMYKIVYKILLFFLCACLNEVYAEESQEVCCGTNEFYGCFSSCDNDCSTLGSRNRTNCRSNIETCKCYCKDGYARDDSGQCISINQCQNDRCLGPNEVLRSRLVCPPETTCDNLEIAFACLYNETEVPQKKCVCEPEFARNSIGECISKEQCTKTTCSKNEVYRCVENCPPEATCKTRNATYHCPLQRAGDCQSKCVCEKGFYRNPLGDCISEAQCDQCPGNHEFFACDSFCDNRCGSSENRKNCSVQTFVCVDQCYCEDNYSRDDKGNCVPNEECPKTTCGKNEVYKCVYSCPPEATCKTRNATYSCPLQTDDCESKCVCQEGFYRNPLGDCISEAQCDQCPGKHEFFGCSTPCDNRCDTLDTESRTNCSLSYPGCIEQCYCEDGYSRNDDNICIGNKACTRGCGLHEYSSSITCPPDECFSLVARFKCDSRKQKRKVCRCQSTFLRKDKNEPCMPYIHCPQLSAQPYT